MTLKMTLLYLLLASSLFPALTSCREQNSEPSSAHPSPSKSKPLNLISIKTGERIEFNARELIIEFVGIKEDSRCPRGASCIQEGKVTAVFKIFKRQESTGKPFELTLKTLQPRLASQNFEGFQIKLIQITPYPDIKTAKSDRSYAAELVIE